MSKYVILKLVTGEEIFAEFVHSIDNKVRIINPLQVVVTREPDENGNLVSNVRANPWCEYSASKTFDIKAPHIISLSDLHEAMHKPYLDLVDAFSREVIVQEDEDGYLREDDYLDFDDSTLPNPDNKVKPNLH